MYHMTGIKALPDQAIRVERPNARLGQIVRDQLASMTETGYCDIDVRWNSDVLIIEARSDDGRIRRMFNCAGICLMERIDCAGFGVKRYFDDDGLTLISEEICGEGAHC